MDLGIVWLQITSLVVSLFICVEDSGHMKVKYCQNSLRK